MVYSYRARLSSLLFSLVVVGLLLGSAALSLIPVHVLAADSIDLWWPTNGSHMTGTQPFKAMIPDVDVSQYSMYWSVDGGSPNNMYNSYTDYQHKEAMVDLSGWTWHGSGPYVITFSAIQNGVQIAVTTTSIYINNGLPTWAPPAPAPVAQIASAPQPTTNPTPSAAVKAPIALPMSDPLSNSIFYIDPDSDAAGQTTVWEQSNPSGAQMMQMLANQPTATWFGNWNTNVMQDVQTLMSQAEAKNSVPVLVAYNIPERDCGGFSNGGSDNPAGYETWIKAFAAGIGSGEAVVILEPDALAQITCLSAQDQQTRLSLLSYAVTTLKQNPNTKVYIDAGHSDWTDPATMATLLQSANIAQADGFATNVSNYMSTANEIAYGTAISNKLNGKHFVIDTSRNGNGSDGQWCNAPGSAIGSKPTTSTGNPLIDAFLWIKVPGESDGTCNGGPSAGTWWPSYALSLIQNVL